MHLQNLYAINFKNYEEVQLAFNPSVNLIVGKNGSGKTNLLDAVYMLSFTKSAFASADAHCIRHGEPYYMVKGTFRKDNKDAEIVTSVQQGSRKVFRENQLDYTRLSEHIGKYPAVLIAPDDTDLVKEGSELRRKFFDGIFCQLDHKYLEDLMAYNNAIKQRNSLLKMFYETGRKDFVALQVYDDQLIKHGTYIHERRKAFIREFYPLYREFFEKIVLKNEDTDLRYQSGLNDRTFAQGLAQSREKDIALQRTSFGIHRDDFEFILGHGDLKRLGSQGQQKSFVIALKLAQQKMVERYTGNKPLLLLDDIFDKLDDARIDQLISIVREDQGQIFITDARPDRAIALVQGIGSTSVFKVENGRVTINNHE